MLLPLGPSSSSSSSPPTNLCLKLKPVLCKRFFSNFFRLGFVVFAQFAMAIGRFLVPDVIAGMQYLILAFIGVMSVYQGPVMTYVISFFVLSSLTFIFDLLLLIATISRSGSLFFGMLRKGFPQNLLPLLILISPVRSEKIKMFLILVCYPYWCNNIMDNV
jgi:hypothetical protein